MKIKYYSLTNILKRKARYNVIFGERSNGKSYSVQEHGLKKFLAGKGQLAVIRRWREDLRGKRGSMLFANLECNGNGENVISKLTNGQYDRVIYISSKWYLGYFDESTQRNVIMDKPFAFAFALSEMEHDKSTSYPEVTTILFDEFMTRGAYLPDEFVLFMNVLSTIIRDRDDVEIFMCANTISKYCPYFKEMGLNHVRKMNKGDIDIYKYGDSGLTVAVEYSDSPNRFKPSDVYFAFDNAKLKMITGGSWELDIYPHITGSIDKEDIVFSYFIKFDEHILQADIVINSKESYTYIHNKTTPIKNEDRDIVFFLTPVELHNWYTNILVPVNDVTKRIYVFFKANKVFYQSNDIGEIMSQYLAQCSKRYR